MSIIIGTFKALEVGKRHVLENLSNSNAEYHYNVPVFVLREATKEEYIENAKKENLEAFDREVKKGAKAHLHPDAHFYEISMD